MKHCLLTIVLFSLGLMVSAQDIVYTDASEFPLFGKVFDQTSARYQRLPASLHGVTREDVWELGLHSAGMYVRFRSDSPIIKARWKSLNGGSMSHMTNVGQGGLDLYTLVDGKWRFVGSGMGKSTKETRERRIVGNMTPVMREYMMYLSLYDGVDSLAIGIEKGYVIEGPAVNSPVSAKPIVMYGTSILQGGCCSRPGMAFTNIIARRVDREVINLGFSGNARCDYEIAELIAQVKDPGLIVLDFVPNSDTDIINEKGENFFRIIRKAHPDVPVIFVENAEYAYYFIDNEAHKDYDSRNAALRAIYDKLRKEGEKKLFYVPCEGLIGTDGEAFVDGVHFTDLGMMRYADKMVPVIKKALKK